MLFQGILTTFAVIAIARTLRQYQAQKVSVYWFTVWALFWIGVCAVAISPQTTDIVADWVGVERGADLIVYISIIILYYAMYRVLMRLERQNRELTDLVRSLAVSEVKSPQKNGHGKDA